MNVLSSPLRPKHEGRYPNNIYARGLMTVIGQFERATHPNFGCELP
jgi:hypothetical protein